MDQPPSSRRASGLPGSAGLCLAAGVVHLDPQQAVFDAMVDGWATQMTSRGLKPPTIVTRRWLLRRFAAFTNEYPWTWSSVDLEEYASSLRCRTPPITWSTIRNYQNPLGQFMDFITDLRTRVAGLLLVVYGQTISRVARLRLEQVTVQEAAVTVRFGDAPVVLEEPLAGLVRTLVSAPVGRSRLTARVPSRWLFSGGAGLSDQHRGDAASPSQRRHPWTSARAGALMHLAANLPTAILARLLGIHPETAERWARASAADFARYAAPAPDGRACPGDIGAARRGPRRSPT